MRKLLPFFLMNIPICLFTFSYAQDFKVVYSINNSQILKSVPDDSAKIFVPLQNNIIKVMAKSDDFQVFSDAKRLSGEWERSTDTTFFEFTLTSRATRGKLLEVKKADGTVSLSFTLPLVDESKNKVSTDITLRPNLMSPYEKAFENEYSGFYFISDYGITIDNRIDGEYEFGGPDFSHIFIDEFGNTIKTTIPQGLADQIYVVHIFYMVPKGVKSNKIYAIRQTRGRFNPALREETGITQSAEDFIIYEKTYSLSKSTDDIEFDLMRTEEDGSKTKLESFKISMSPSYHWSIHAGLVNTWLSNPDFQLVEDPQNPANKVLKRSNAGNRGVVTMSATLYTSPFTLIRYGIQKRKLMKGKSVHDLKNPVPKSQKWSKNYLFERSFLDRIYPTIGVGLVDKTFENLFGGFNLEFARGGYIFLGIHYGKVNFFDEPDNFEYGKTPITQAEFDLRKDIKWRVNFALGVNIDFVIFSNFFK